MGSSIWLASIAAAAFALTAQGARDRVIVRVSSSTVVGQRASLSTQWPSKRQEVYHLYDCRSCLPIFLYGCLWILKDGGLEESCNRRGARPPFNVTAQNVRQGMSGTSLVCRRHFFHSEC